MKNAATLLASAMLFAVGATGCSSFVPFSYELRTEHRLTDGEVKNLQFYSSHQITLRREVQSHDRQVTPGHTLRLVSGRSVEEVLIPARTPGVATRVSADAISVSFVSGTSLDFAVRGARTSLGSHGDLLAPFAVSEGSFRPRPGLAAGFLGQYAQPPGPPPRQVQIAGGDSPPPSFDNLGGNYFLALDSSGQVPFANVSWEAVDETSQAHLLIDADKLEETEERRTVLPGVRLDN